MEGDFVRELSPIEPAIAADVSRALGGRALAGSVRLCIFNGTAIPVVSGFRRTSDSAPGEEHQMTHTGCATLVAALVLTIADAIPPASATPRRVQDSPDEYIEQFTGRSATDCGQHGIPRAMESRAAGEVELKASLACALNASGRPEAFRTVRQLQGIDSLVYEGLLGKPDGTIYLFSYDSAPCGGRNCAGRFVIQRCLRPMLATDRLETRFSCSRS